jgi:hypothetical protein
MTGAFLGTRPLLAAGIVLIGAALAACDGGEATTQNTSPAATPSTSYPIVRSSGDTATATSAPSIAGVPAATVVAGQTYSFQPQVSTTSGVTVSFTIANLPSWAKFNTTTGLLSGTPTASQVGQYSGIAIAVMDGSQSATLAAFSINVAAGNSADAVTLSWQPPTENADGTPLMDLKGYQIHYGPKSKTYSTNIKVTNPGLTSYVVQNLAAGEYYFALTAYNSTGKESSLSPEVSTTLN